MLLFRRMTVLERAGTATQCLKGYNMCGQGLPANFCCSPDTNCVVLASKTTAICCPKGNVCNRITPTTCNVELMNVTSHPDSPILTTALDSDLPSCGNSTCCPIGYKCASSGGGTPYCVMGENQAVYTSLVPQQTKGVLSTISHSTTTHTSTSATATADFRTSTTLPLPTSTASANTSTTAPDAEGAGSRSAGVIAGSVAGAIIIFLGLGLFFWAKKRKLSRPPGSVPAPSTSHHQHQWRYQPPAYDISKADPLKGPQMNTATYCETLTVSPAYVPVTTFAELDGTRTSQRTPSMTQVAQPPVELPASPVSFSMWSRQQEGRRSFRNSTRTTFMPPGAAFVPLSRFAATPRHGHPDDGDNWI